MRGLKKSMSFQFLLEKSTVCSLVRKKTSTEPVVAIKFLASKARLDVCWFLGLVLLVCMLFLSRLSIATIPFLFSRKFEEISVQRVLHVGHLSSSFDTPVTTFRESCVEITFYIFFCVYHGG